MPTDMPSDTGSYPPNIGAEGLLAAQQAANPDPVYSASIEELQATGVLPRQILGEPDAPPVPAPAPPVSTNGVSIRQLLGGGTVEATRPALAHVTLLRSGDWLISAIEGQTPLGFNLTHAHTIGVALDGDMGAWALAIDDRSAGWWETEAEATSAMLRALQLGADSVVVE